MPRHIFFVSALVICTTVVLGSIFGTMHALWLLLIVVPLTLLGLWDVFLSGHNVLINYPVIGHLRYAFEFISPNIRQYFIETNSSGRPFNNVAV